VAAATMAVTMTALDIQCEFPVRAHNAGLFISRGVGTHPTRVIDSHEILFVDTGSLSLWEEDRHFDIGAGESLLLVPGRRHGGAADYSPDLRFYWMHFDVSPSGDISENTTRNGCIEVHLPQHARVSRADRLTELFRMFLDDQETGGLEQTTADLLLCLILSEIAKPSPATGDHVLRSTAIAEKARQHIKTHFHESLTTSTISRAIEINSDYLERIYKRSFNQTIIQAVHHYRIRYSRQLLLDETHYRNIDQIASRCGYTDSGYFRRVFKKHVGMTPKAFQKLHARVHVNTDSPGN
jgi:AraC-like DNA-binding protein